MRIHVKLLLTALTAAFVLSAGLSTASATRLSLSNQQITAVFENLVFGENLVECRVTMEGSFHRRTFTKVSGSLLGYITRAAVTSSCVKGAATVLTETLPWHIQYEKFNGTLPRFEGVGLMLINASFRVNALGQLCLYKSTQARPFFGLALVEPGGLVTGLKADETRGVPKFEGGILCPSNGTLRGTGRVTLTGRTTNISIVLIP